MSLPTLSPVARILWILLVLLVGGYLLGRWLNRRRSQSIGEWLQAGIKVIGSETNWKFPRGVSSGAEVKISRGIVPFRQIEIAYFLLTREFPFLWGIELLRGKRDMLAIRADLREVPVQEFEVVPLRSPLRHTLDHHAGAQAWQWVEMPAGLGMATRTPAAATPLARVRAFLDVYGSSIQRMSLRERSPNLVLFAHVSGIDRAPAKEFFQAVRRLLDQAEGRKT
jgi:hypothetical protein